MISYGEYKSVVGKAYNEEPCDLLFYRPMAYLIVKLTFRLPLTPNHFSFLSFLTALAAGVSLSLGTREGFLWGGLGIILFCVWDCCDGMLARMKQNGTPYGKYIDMFVDLVANTVFVVGTSIGLYESGFLTTAVLMLLCGGFTLVHVATYQSHKNQFLAYQNKDPDEESRELENLEANYVKMKESAANPITVFMLKMCLVFSQQQRNLKSVADCEVENYVRANKMIFPFWGVIAGSTHLTILTVALFLGRVEVYIVYALLFANLWTILMRMIQHGANKNVSAVI